MAGVGFVNEVIATVDVEFGHTPFPIAHWNTFVPKPKLLIVVLFKLGFVIVPIPETKVHVPVPTEGIFAAIIAPEEQTDWDGPAFETVGLSSRFIETVEDDEGQTPLLIVHCKIFTPTVSDVKPDVGKIGAVIVPPPETKFHNPAPIVGMFPASVAAVEHTV